MDEMDLVSRLKDVPPLRPEAYEQARATLGAAMAESHAVDGPGAAPARDQRFSWVRNLRLGVLGKVGLGFVGAAAVAVAAVAIVPANSSSPTPTAPTAAPVVDSQLVTLASNVKASSAPLSGDASLVIRTQTRPSGPPYVTYNLYTDSGEIYVVDTRDQLPGAIDRGDNLAEAWHSKVLAAARFAATGDLTEARKQMVNASNNPWGLGLSPAEAQQVWDESEAERIQIWGEKGVANPQPRPRPTGKDLEDGINNTLWTNTLGALDSGAADADVRAGVLRLLSTIPDVTVTNSTTNGQPSLILTAGAALFSGDGEHVLTINADTALPISSEFKVTPGQSDSVPSLETFESSRVTVADVKAGRF